MIYEFEGCVLDETTQELRRDGDVVHVEPQVLAVLQHLVTNRDRMVTKIELLDEVWGDRFVSESALTSRIKLARKACGDSGREQRIVKTVHGRGYRFVADVVERRPGDSRGLAPTGDGPRPVRGRSGSLGVVGRDRELAQLESVVGTTAIGERSCVFVTGEAGAGKSTLVAELLERCEPLDRWHVLRGRCLLTRGGGVEPYFGLLDAFTELSRTAPDPVRTALERTAPSWLVQLPSLVDDDLAERLERRLLGSSPQRMLREGADAVEELAHDRPVLLVVEDLQWADDCTLDVIDLLVRRITPTPLMVVGTARDEPGAHRDLIADATGSGCAVELPIGGLDRAALAALVADRLGVETVPERLADVAEERSGGVPLFVGEIATAWARQGLVHVEDGGLRIDGTSSELAATIPPTLPMLIGRELSALSDAEVEVLEAASVAGSTFDGASVAAGVGRPVPEVEATLSAMARRLTHVVGEGRVSWPDGTVSTSYSFDHRVTRDVVYDRLSVGRRADLHGRIGLALEAGHLLRPGRTAADGSGSPRAAELAVTLAGHFVQAGDTARAVEYGRRAGEQAAARDAHDHAMQFFDSALTGIDRLPEGPERDRAELLLRVSLGPSLVATRGWFDPAVSVNYERALALCPDPCPEAAAARYGLATVSELRGEFERTERLLVPLVGDEDSGELVVEALELLACSTFHQGAFERSVRNAGTVLESWDDEAYSVPMSRIAEHPTSSCNSWLSLSAWFLGRSDESLERAERAVALAERNRYALSTAVQQRAMLHQVRDEPEQCAWWGNRTREVGGEQDFPMRVIQGDIYRGWALAATGSHGEGIELIAGGLARFHEAGARLNEAYYLGLYADALLHADRPVEALERLDEAIASMHRTTRTYFHESELHRLRARALVRIGPDGVDAARAALDESEARARGRHSPALSLRTVTDRLELERRHGEPEPWREALAPLLAVYDDQRPTPDVVRARTLVEH